MDPARRRKVIFVSVLAAVVLLPLIALSPPGMTFLENYAVNHAGREWAGSLQLDLAEAYGFTLRRAEQQAAFQRFLDNFPDRCERGYAKYMIAECMEKENRVSKRASLEAYEDFLDEYAEDPLFQTYPDWQYYVTEAERAIDRIKAL